MIKKYKLLLFISLIYNLYIKELDLAYLVFQYNLHEYAYTILKADKETLQSHFLAMSRSYLYLPSMELLGPLESV